MEVLEPGEEADFNHLCAFLAEAGQCQLSLSFSLSLSFYLTLFLPLSRPMPSVWVGCREERTALLLITG